MQRPRAEGLSVCVWNRRRQQRLIWQCDVNPHPHPHRYDRRVKWKKKLSSVIPNCSIASILHHHHHLPPHHITHRPLTRTQIHLSSGMQFSSCQSWLLPIAYGHPFLLLQFQIGRIPLVMLANVTVGFVCRRKTYTNINGVEEREGGREVG